MENKKLQEIVYVDWTESERGWGLRPDGCSLHLNEHEYELFLRDYNRSLPEDVPDEYSFTNKPVVAYSSNSLVEKIKTSEHGLRLYGSNLGKFLQQKDLVREKK